MINEQRCVTVRFHEIALKGKNRPLFINALIDNLRRATEDLSVQVRRGPLMIRVDFGPDTSWETLQERISRVFGVVKFAPAYRLNPDIETIEDLLQQVLPHYKFQTFRITAQRGDKSFPITSMEMNNRLGSFVEDLTNAQVNLNKPDLNIRVEVFSKEALVYFCEVAGPGGLPVGTGGKVVSLLSGGIDSPIASHRMMRRGCETILVHFHSFPLVRGSSREKALALARLLNQYQFDTKLYLVPFADLQKQVILSVPPPYRVVTYRRFMARISERIARIEGAKALVTGESLGQVGSQTLDNLSSIEAAVSIPVLRPLIGMDKQEIIQQARTLGTYPISIEPDEDCCSLFVPKHPATHSTPQQMDKQEGALDTEGLVGTAVAQAEVKEFFI